MMNKRNWILLYSFLFSITALILISSCKNEKKQDVKSEKKDTVNTKIEIKRTYGIAVDSFDIEHGVIQRNQNLSEILHPYKVSYQKIDMIAKASDTIFNLKKIRAGNTYALFMTKDSSKNLHYFVYEHTPVDFVVFDLSDTAINIYKDKKDVDLKKKTCSGSIESSLWNAMTDNDLDPMLALELSDIYAWSVDFFGLQKGDSFKIIYEEKCIGDKIIGLNKIISALFFHADTQFYAIPFVQDSVESYFDEEGNSLKRAFLKAPLKFNRISSHFSNSRLHPILKIRRPHHGIDYAAPYGTPVVAIGDGKVIYKKYSGGAGYMVKIKHNSVYTTAYLHLSKYGNIKTGQYVKQGDVIGYVGSTGLSTGPHLDFRFYKSGYPINPLKVESPPVDPIHEENLKDYNKVKEKYIKELKEIK